LVFIVYFTKWSLKMKTERTRLRRMPELGEYDKDAVYAILDAMPMCHIGYIDSFGTPAVMPTLQWREGNNVYWHASGGSRSLRAMKGKQICLTVTLLDGFVMARSAINHSVNYRSTMIYGEAFAVTDAALKAAHLKAMVEQLYPSRWDKLRPMTDIELKQTTVFGMEINEASAKIRGHGVGDDEADLDFPIWSGVVPVSFQIGTPIDDEHNKTGTTIGDDIRAITLG
jgi:nitroimidazol reductase NimA-like FMN-containing flavoprotein (pyridoxamine 5'-phosphate oxidase superfamily)